MPRMLMLVFLGGCAVVRTAHIDQVVLGHEPDSVYLVVTEATEGRVTAQRLLLCRHPPQGQVTCEEVTQAGTVHSLIGARPFDRYFALCRSEAKTNNPQPTLEQLRLNIPELRGLPDDAPLLQAAVDGCDAGYAFGP